MIKSGISPDFVTAMRSDRDIRYLRWTLNTRSRPPRQLLVWPHSCLRAGSTQRAFVRQTCPQSPLAPIHHRCVVEPERRTGLRRVRAQRAFANDDMLGDLQLTTGRMSAHHAAQHALQISAERHRHPASSPVLLDPFIDTYLARSNDRGASFTDVRVSHDMWDPRINPPISLSGEFIGDYQGLVADNCAAIPFVNDTHLANDHSREPRFDHNLPRSPYQEVFSWRVPNTHTYGGQPVPDTDCDG